MEGCVRADFIVQTFNFRRWFKFRDSRYDEFTEEYYMFFLGYKKKDQLEISGLQMAMQMIVNKRKIIVPLPENNTLKKYAIETPKNFYIC